MVCDILMRSLQYLKLMHFLIEDGLEKEEEVPPAGGKEVKNVIPNNEEEVRVKVKLFKIVY